MKTKRFAALGAVGLAVVVGVGIWTVTHLRRHDAAIAPSTPSEVTKILDTSEVSDDRPFPFSKRVVKVKCGQSSPEVSICEYDEHAAEILFPVSPEVMKRLKDSRSAEGAWLRDTVSGSWQEMLSSYDSGSRPIIEKMNQESGDRIRQDKDKGAHTQIAYKIRFLYRVEYTEGSKEYVFIKTKEGPIEAPPPRDLPVLDEFVTVFVKEDSRWVRTLTMRSHPIFFEACSSKAGDWRDGMLVGQPNPPPAIAK